MRGTVALLNAVSSTVETFCAEMDHLASQLPEYEAVMVLTGASKSTGPQLMAEIGDPRRFAYPKSLVGFAGTDPIKDESGDDVSDSNPTSKRGSPYHQLFRLLYGSTVLSLMTFTVPSFLFRSGVFLFTLPANLFLWSQIRLTVAGLPFENTNMYSVFCI